MNDVETSAAEEAGGKTDLDHSVDPTNVPVVLKHQNEEPFDRDDFDAVDYINDLFPDGRYLWYI